MTLRCPSRVARLGDSWIPVTLLVVLLAAGCGPEQRVEQQKRPAVSVVVAPVTERQITPRQTFVGTVVPLRRSVVGSAVDGRVVEYLVEVGNWVTKDQPLCKLLTDTLEIELAAAKAELALRESELAELNRGSRPEEIAQSQARLLAAEALMNYTSTRLERTKTLYQQGRTASQEELDEATSRALAAKQEHAAAEFGYELVKLGPRSEKKDQAQAQVDARKAEVERIESRLAKFTIRAPFDGYVVAEHTEVGAWLSTSDPVAEVVQLDPAEVEVFVPERYIAATVLGTEVEVRIEALPDREEPLHGTVVSVVPQADVRSRSFPVRIQFPNEREGDVQMVNAGMLAHVTLAVGQTVEGTVVPKDALVLQENDASIYVLDDPQNSNSTVRRVPVTTGVPDGMFIQVTGDIAVGDQVVVRGNERLSPGAEVVVVDDGITLTKAAATP